MYEKFTQAAVDEFHKGVDANERQLGSPVVLIITALIPVVADMIKECFSDPERAASESRRPGLIARWRLRKEVRRQIPDRDPESEQVREQVYGAVLAAGRLATADDFR